MACASLHIKTPEEEEREAREFFEDVAQAARLTNISRLVVHPRDVLVFVRCPDAGERQVYDESNQKEKEQLTFIRRCGMRHNVRALMAEWRERVTRSVMDS